jgi:hypothetical protein
LAKRAGTYKGEKRRKELSRQKKQEEKRQRRVIKKFGSKEDEEILNPEGEPEGIENNNEKVGDVSGSV